jgi:hypothetical protein
MRRYKSLNPGVSSEVLYNRLGVSLKLYLFLKQSFRAESVWQLSAGAELQKRERSSPKHPLRACLVAWSGSNQAQQMQALRVWFPAPPPRPGSAHAKMLSRPGSQGTWKSAVSLEPGSSGASASAGRAHGRACRHKKSLLR